MTKISLLLILSFFIQTSFAQVNWVKRAGGANTDLANGLWASPQKNLYVTGSFSLLAKFHKTEIVGKGGGDVYVAAYNPDGIPLWIKSYGGKLDDFATAITGDPEGNLYITGVFTDTAQFEKETLITKGADVFVAKIGPKGNLIWAKKMETSGTVIPQAIAVTDQGGVYIGGLFSGPYDQTIKRQMGQTDGFVTKLDWQGTVSWTKVMGGSGFDEITMLSTDPWGRVVAAGVYDKILYVEERELAGNSSKSSFAVRLEATGDILWTKSFSGFDVQSQISDAVTDVQGTVYLTGKFSGETQFSDQVKISKGQTDVFVCAIKTDGQVQWISTLGGDDVDEGMSIQLTENQKSVMVAGFFNKFIEVGKKTLKGEFDNQVFIARWDNRGNLDELRKQDFNSTFQCAGHKLDAKGNLWICGSFTAKSSFGKTGLQSAGEEDIFITAISDSKVTD